MLNELGWPNLEVWDVALDDRWDRDAEDAVFRPGTEVVSLVPEDIGGEQLKKAPPGTRFWGRVYVDTQDVTALAGGRPAALLVKYERVKLPGKEEMPVCAIGRSEAVYKVAKDGTVTATNAGLARVVLFYPYQ